MIPANSSVRRASVDTIAARYGVDRTTVAGWAKKPDFPSPVDRAGKIQVFDLDAVDSWLRDYQPGAWVRGQEGSNPFGLPEGKDNDLLTLEEIAELDGTVVFRRREPTPVAVLRTYISRGDLARPDRLPDDGKDPGVSKPSWFRSNAYEFLNHPRTTIPRSKTGSPAVRAKTDVSEVAPFPFDLPAGSDSDLLSLPDIRRIDAEVRGRPAPSDASLQRYMRKGQFPQPDRTPGDGSTPAVDEPMWLRSTAYGFIRRPLTGRPRK
jgi:predicted DNA-binding transcriptional regulator AlpA